MEGASPLAPTKLTDFGLELHYVWQRGIESETDRVRAEFVLQALKPKDIDLAKIVDTIACRPAVPESAHKVGSDPR